MRLLRLALAGVCALAIILGVISCSQTETARLDTPTFYDEEAIGQARALIGEGYDLLDSNDVDGAAAKFAEIEQSVPSGLVGPYHTACAYARTGDKEAAFQQLTQLLDNGFDSPDNIRNDSDFESLQSDPRFQPILDRAAQNYESGSAAFAQGLPEYTEAPEKFATEEELDEWASRQNRALRAQSRFWTSTEYITAKMDFAARKLAALRELKADDAEFDYSLERVRQAVQLKPMYEYGWGAVSDLALREANSYLQSAPAGEGAGEANYLAAFALSQKYREDDPQRFEGFQQAELYLAEVDEGSEYHGAARAMALTNRLQSPDPSEAELTGELRTVIEKSSGDDKVYRLVSTRFANGAARFLWPIQLGMPDLDGSAITLEEYQGKALLIDFWAIWCPPCRAELPNLVEVYQQYHPKGFEIVSVSLDYAEDTTPEAYREWIDSAGMDWRHAYGGAGWNTDAIRRYFVGSIPAPFLVGPDGSLVAWGEDLRGERLAGSVEKALGI